MQSILLLRYAKWHYVDAPRNIFAGWANILWFNFNYFSVPLLLQTLFAPWRRIAWNYGRGFNLGSYFYVLSSNLISRILGAIVRSVLIAGGLTVQIGLLLAGTVVLFLWLILPALIAAGFFYGFSLLF